MLYTKVMHYTQRAAMLLAVVLGLCTMTFGASSVVLAAPATPAPTPANQNAKAGGDCSQIEHCDLINKYIEPFIAFLSAAVGVAVVGSIIVGGIQYAGSANDPSKVTAAKNRIRNAILALLTYIFLFSLLNFLVPGGIL